MNHWKEPEAFDQQAQLPAPLYVPETQAMQQAYVQRQIHAEQMRNNPNGPFRLLGTSFFTDMSGWHYVAGAGLLITGLVAGYYANDYLKKRAKAKKNGGSRPRRAKRAERDLDPDTWDESGDEE